MARPKRTRNIEIGQRFTRLVVIDHAPPKRRKEPCFLCRCDCGNITAVVEYDLHSGNTRSCGCLAKEIRTRSVTTHGKSRTTEYNIWSKMRGRCLNQKLPDYIDYGARGITICERWGRFENFLSDMGQRPSPQHTLDRINNDGPYSPENCRWALPIVQMNNKRCNRLITFRGKTQTMMQWVRELRHLNMTRAALEHRLERGWPIELALTMKVSNKNRREQLKRNELGQFLKKET